jgi:predicted phosphohydrolase
MFLQYFSDLHLERHNNLKFMSLIKTVAPVLILAGDIGDPNKSLYKDFLKIISKNYDKIFLISGNHEYYNKTIEETDNKINEICNSLKNVCYLNNTIENYNGYQFVGTTLWTKLNNEKIITRDLINIKDLTKEKYNLLHKKSYDFIDNSIQNKKSIVITHHVPSYNFIDKSYLHHHNYHDIFYSNSDKLIRKPIVTWIYGHTHKPYNGLYNNVKMRCNPIGYPEENFNMNFNKSL